jgi:flagellar motor switch protein FliG
MSCPAERFTRLQKIGIFLIAVGEKKARQILKGLDLETVEKINAAIQSLKKLTPQEKAAVMIEFGDFFYKDKPLSAKLKEPSPAPPAAAAPPQQKAPSLPAGEGDEKAILDTLHQLRRRVDPGKIDWGRAGYDFGEGFKGPGSGRR